MDEILNLIGDGAETIWAQIQKSATVAGIEATRVMLELFYVMKSPDTNMIDKALIGAALAYQLLPEDFIPRDKLGFIGLLDNGITLAFAYNRVKASVTPEIEQQVNNILHNWFGAQEEENVPQLAPPEGSSNGHLFPQTTVQTQGGTVPSWDTSYNTTQNHPKKTDWEDEDVVID